MRYRVGWAVPGRVLALTHFEPIVTEPDFAAIMADTSAALATVGGPFHLLIDNRLIADQTITSLDMILHALPQLERSPLRWIAVVLPDAIKHAAAALPPQRRGEIRLKHVASLAAAFEQLASVDVGLNPGQVDQAFFEPAPAE
ncbi:MAG TPA: hypothetical protein VD886_16430 [Herpetosiphonaceae bacterium]|nr:hypothetical protein [Herpetosiphonaceae bacterium]